MCSVEANEVICAVTSTLSSTSEYKACRIWGNLKCCQQHICRTRIVANWKVDYEISGRIWSVSSALLVGKCKTTRA
jgi:hypothetical protein